MEDLISRWSAALVRSTPHYEYRPELVPEWVREQGTVTVPGATAEQIRRAEGRLGTELPPSYKEFLSITDGALGGRWLELDDNGSRLPPPTLLRSTSAIDWTRRCYLAWGSMWAIDNSDPFVGPMGRTSADRPPWLRVPHDEAAYLLGLGHQAKVGQVLHTLMIGDWGQHGILALNPLVADGAGEWEAVEYDFGDDPRRFPSFGHWLEDATRQVEEEFPEIPRDEAEPPREEPNQRPIELDDDQRQAFLGWIERLRKTAVAKAIRDVAPGLEQSELDAEVERLLASNDASSSDPAVGEDNPPQWMDALNAIAHEATSFHNDFYALLGVGRIEEAAEQVVERSSTESYTEMYDLAEFDTPVVWDALERVADNQQVGSMALIAASRTSAPFLVPRAVDCVDGKGPDAVASLLALELQRTRAAGDALVNLYNDGGYWALRAMARRRDPRVLDPCLALLADPDPDRALTGAETLRDLRHPESIPALTDAVSAGKPQISIVAAHALAMMRVTDALPALSDLARRTDDDNARTLLRRWIAQLMASDEW